MKEEAGIEVGQVRYHSSQPWPFPSSLMIGCHARALTTDIRIDDEEMTDVRWFPRADVVSALREEHPHLRVPAPIAIAHHLIKAWAEGDVRWDCAPRGFALVRANPALAGAKTCSLVRLSPYRSNAGRQSNRCLHCISIVDDMQGAALALWRYFDVRVTK